LAFGFVFFFPLRNEDNFISCTNGSFGKNSDENALPGHDAVPDGVEDRATVMTNLADLSHFRENVLADFQLCSKREKMKHLSLITI